MTKLLFSVRITEKYFSDVQIESLEQELASFNSKSEFMRKIIKFYLKHNEAEEELLTNSPSEVKKLLEENNLLLQQLLKQGSQRTVTTAKEKKSDSQAKEDNEQTKITYQGGAQDTKTDQALSLLDQF